MAQPKPPKQPSDVPGIIVEDSTKPPQVKPPAKPIKSEQVNGMLIEDY